MFNLIEKGKSVNNITTVGIDLAKNVFSLHGVDERGREVLRRTVRRGQLPAVVAQLPACLIGLEACSGAHEWARQFGALGHTVRLMAPKFVAPYRRGGKNDGNDAEAICEAVSRPSMRFVPIKSAEQQSVLALHRVRQGFVEERTATLNRIRGLLAEFGHVLPQRAVEVRRRLPALLEQLPPLAARALGDLQAHVRVSAHSVGPRCPGRAAGSQPTRGPTLALGTECSRATGLSPRLRRHRSEERSHRLGLARQG